MAPIMRTLSSAQPATWNLLPTACVTQIYKFHSCHYSVFIVYCISSACNTCVKYSHAHHSRDTHTITLLTTSTQSILGDQLCNNTSSLTYALIQHRLACLRQRGSAEGTGASIPAEGTDACKQAESWRGTYHWQTARGSSPSRAPR